MNISKSLAMQLRAKALIPGMTQLLSKRPDQFSQGVWPGYYSKAEGAYVWDLDDNKYLDMSIAGIGANVLGYADPDVNEAVSKAVVNGTSCSLNCVEEVYLAELLCQLHPWANMARFTRTGGEAMAVAVRIARAHTNRPIVAFCGYHGWHDWYLAANVGTENALGEHLLTGLDPRGVPVNLAGTALPFSYNKLEQLEEILKKNPDTVGAIVLEPVRNAQPQEGFLQGVRELADKYGCVVVVDEISSGFRLNSGGAHLLYNLRPDIAVFSKALGNGYPIGAIIGTKEVMESAQSTFISSTNWTERIGPTAAIATIQKHKKLNAGQHLVNVGKSIQEIWLTTAKKYNINIDVGGIYPLSHFAFKDANPLSLKALFVQEMLSQNILASTSYYSMCAHTNEHILEYKNAAEKAFEIIAEAMKNNNVDKMLKGKPSTAGFKRLN